MFKSVIHYFFLIVFISACTPASITSEPEATTQVALSAAKPTDTPEHQVQLPPVVGPDPSYHVGAFYYPWYGNVETDQVWEHWEGGGDYQFYPPEDVGSDYYPVLGAYSVNDPNTVAQHMAWLREAGVGVAISSWWGRSDFSDTAIPLLLDMADRYGIKIAFHVEPYQGRTAEGLLEDVKYIYENYGDHPAFFWTTDSSYYSADDKEKGLFFLFAPGTRDFTCKPISICAVEMNYWQETMDAIHDLPEGGIVIAGNTYGPELDDGHFDGGYNYVTLELAEDSFDWARVLQMGSWYVPSVIPGNSARRIGYPEETYVSREGGVTYLDQWESALSAGIEPQMVTITSFNEWHEGSQIEPAAANADNGSGFTYESYDPIPENGYLSLTREYVDNFLKMDWSGAAAYPVRIRVTTTSDWTTLLFIEGGEWIRPKLVTASEEVTNAGLDDNQILLNQPIERAQVGESVEVIFDMNFIELDEEGALLFGIERGSLGATTVVISTFINDSPEIVATFVWEGNVPNQGNMEIFEMPTKNILYALH